MSRHFAGVQWRRQGATFTDKRYSRARTWTFDGGLSVPASASPHVVPLPMSMEAAVDPEEAFVAAISSCHMLWFLALAAEAGLVVDEYTDQAAGTIARNDAGRQAITLVVLKPRVVFHGEAPGRDVQQSLHHRAHEACFIANSIRTEVRVEV